MNYRFTYLLLVLMIFFSCSKNQITLPPNGLNANLINTTPISNTVMKNMEGIYSLSSGSSSLGSEFVCKVSKNKISFFSNNENGIFFILGYGYNQANGSIQFSGFWRYSQNATQGTIKFSVASTDGASDLLLNGIVSHLQLKGNFNPSNQAISLQYKRPFSQYVLTHEFVIFAHHGVQTTANPPYAQNSINGVLHDEDYGVDALEFDVRLTKDNVPICMHDANYDIRLTQKGPVYGDFNLYTFDFLENYVRLVDGQKIPSLAQALQVFVDSTTMKYFWMDVKGDPDVFKYMEPIVRDAYARAHAANRDVVIFADLPSTSVIDEYRKQPSYGADLPCMCELSLQDAIDNNCKYFGPRFTLGLLLDDVNKGHSLGIKTYTWSLNDKTTIEKYLQDGNFDGAISDYPAYLIYDYYGLK
ncbi:glycerophosphodiester phosphodiesterase [Mucilaginibacter sp. McL0603]|uniref:glycerophosphodiester phosphodiesterase n=1 Tax=Mucilaginibacter sp. McL0603 TaxID=3415670 RepID=UPI003CE9C3E6